MNLERVGLNEFLPLVVFIFTGYSTGSMWGQKLKDNARGRKKGPLLAATAVIFLLGC